MVLKSPPLAAAALDLTATGAALGAASADDLSVDLPVAQSSFSL